VADTHTHTHTHTHTDVPIMAAITQPRSLVTDLAGIFHLVDRSGTGVLDWMELRRCLRGLGFPISKKEARDFVREKCRVDGFVKLRHFYEIVDELGSAKRDALREMKYGFRLFTGTEASIRSAACITEADLRRATVSAHISADIPAMLAIADVDGDGKVGKSDFIQVMSRVRDPPRSKGPVSSPIPTFSSAVFLDGCFDGSPHFCSYILSR
jgi:Ca2+-binding EF-hand superfamily protein